MLFTILYYSQFCYYARFVDVNWLQRDRLTCEGCLYNCAYTCRLLRDFRTKCEDKRLKKTLVYLQRRFVYINVN